MDHSTNTLHQEPTHHSPQPKAQNNLLIPLAIVIAGALIAGAVLLTQRSSEPTISRPKNAYPEKNLVAITPTEHILGSTTAPIMIVEHSDTECPYCQMFHPIMHSIISQFGPSGKVSWVYRHFSFHERAPKEAEATECVAAAGGNEKFWQFLDLLFSKKNFQEQPYKGIDPAQLPALAASVGVSKSSVSTCLSNGTFKNKIATDYQNAVAAGGQGTPYIVIVSKAEISKAARKIVEDANMKYIKQSQNPSQTPDILYVSEDKHKIVLGGAMPQELVTQIIQELIKVN